MTGSRQIRLQMREDALSIFRAGLAAADPAQSIKQACRLKDNSLIISGHAYDLDRFSTILVMGAGKASAAMAGTVEELLGSRIDAGLVVTKYNHGASLRTIRIIEAGHPVPDENGVSGATKMLELAQSADKNTLVIFLISGGGSALATLPAPGLTLADKQRATDALLRCGAAIHEINTIRKHLSGFKGGLLAKAVFPGTMISLVISDVVGNDLSTIASGPAVPDPTSFRDCLDIIQAFGIEKNLPVSVRRHLKKGADGLLAETPKPGDPVFEQIRHCILADNFAVLAAAKTKAEDLGYRSLILSSMIEGETREVAKVHTGIAREIIQSGHPVKPPACILSGGETTVTIQGSGKGGRNQEFGLAAARDIHGLAHTVMLSCGTDGTDGPTDAAGALVDHTTVSRAQDKGLDIRSHLVNNDAYPFLDTLGDLVKTGPTRTNVMDMRLLLVHK